MRKAGVTKLSHHMRFDDNNNRRALWLGSKYMLRAAYSAAVLAIIEVRGQHHGIWVLVRHAFVIYSLAE